MPQPLHRLLLLLALFFLPLQTQAFINIESLRQNFQDGFYGSSGAAVSGSSGNVRIFDIAGNSQNIYKHEQREYLIITNYRYGEASGVKNTNNGNFHLRYAQRFLSDWQWEVFSQAEFNEFQNLALRTLAGGGFRFRLFDDTQNSFYLGAGTFYEDEQINDDEDQANFRGNIYLSFRNATKLGLEAVLVIYYQPSYKTVDDYRIRTTMGLETGLSESLRLVNTFRFSYDSRPPEGVLKEDISYSIGLNFSY